MLQGSLPARSDGVVISTGAFSGNIEAMYYLDSQSCRLSAGVVSIKLAGFSCIGLSGGNIDQAGVAELCDYRADGLMEILDIIL